MTDHGPELTMNTVSQIPWDEVIQSFDQARGVLDQDLVSLGSLDDEKLQEHWDSLTSFWDKVEDDWSRHLGDNIKSKLRSDLSFARLQLAAVFDDDSNSRTHAQATGQFTDKEVRLMRDTATAFAGRPQEEG